MKQYILNKENGFMRKVALLLLFLAFLPNCSQPGKDEIINDVTKKVQKRKLVQCRIEMIITNSWSEPKTKQAVCTYKLVSIDKLTETYYNIKMKRSETIYNGKEFLEYVPSIYGDSVVNATIKTNSPEKFTKREIITDGQKYESPAIYKSNLFFDEIPINIIKKIQRVKNSDIWIKLPDSTINDIKCLRLKNSVFFNEDGKEKEAFIIYAFDKINGMPVYTYFWHPLQKRETYYYDYRFDEPGMEKLFTKGAFPGKLKIIENIRLPEIKLPEDGTKAPEWELQSITGKCFSMEYFHGDPVLLEFSLIGCGNCMDAVDGLNELKDKNPDFNIISIYSHNSKKELQRYFSGKKVKYDVLPDTMNIYSKFHVSSYPTFFLIDKKGVIKKSLVGYNDKNMKYLLKTLKEME